MECHPVSDPTHKTHQDPTAFSCLSNFARPKPFGFFELLPDSFLGVHAQPQILSTKVKQPKGKRKTEKSKSILFTLWPFEFLPDALPAKHAQPDVPKSNSFEGRRTVEKSKSILFTFWLFEFWPDAFSGVNAQPCVRNSNLVKGRRKTEKPKNRKVKGKKNSRKVEKYTCHFLTFWFFAGCLFRCTCAALGAKVEQL